MAALGLRLLLGGEWLLKLLLAGFQWLVEKPARLAVAVAIFWFAFHLFVIEPRQRHDRDAWKSASAKWETAAHAWQGAHGKLLADVRLAQAAAAAADRANVERVKREYQGINERTADDYEARLGDTRAAVERVRRQYAAAAAGDQGDGGRADVPQSLTARCQALGAADCDALLAALPERLAAAEDNTSKLIELQDYVRSSLLLDFSGTSPSSSEAVGQKEGGR